MSVSLSFAGAAGTDLAAAGIGLTKVTNDTGAFRLSGYGRAYRALNTTVHYRHSTQLASPNYNIEWGFLCDSTTIAERIGVVARDTTTSQTTRNGVLCRLKSDSGTSVFIEIYKIINSAFTIAASAPLTIEANKEYRFRFVCNGNQFSVWRIDLTTPVEIIAPVTISDAVLQNAGVLGIYASPNDPVSSGGSAGDMSGTGHHLTAVSLSYAGVTASAQPPAITVVPPTGSASAEGSPAVASAAPPAISVVAPTGSASSGNPLALFLDFAGCNISATSTITNANTASPTVDIVIRNPEGLTQLFQHFRGAFDFAAGRNILVRINMATKEGGSGFLSTWSGPYWANTYSDHNAWQPLARVNNAGTLEFTIPAGSNSRVYFASMPPNTRPQVMSFMNELMAAHPTMFHDDVPARVTAGIGPWICDYAPTVQDELGRSISNEPMLGFRIGNDAVGDPATKKQIVWLAGAHCGEDHGWIQMRGALQRWLTAPELASVRNTHNLFVYPIIAANGNALGYRRFEPRPDFAGGDDINREWRDNTIHPLMDKWIAIMAANHGANYTNVVALIDFHDLSYSTQVIVYYYRGASTNLTAIRSVIDAEFPSALGLQSTSTDTATDRFQQRGVQPSITAEVSDEGTSLTGFLNIGAGWADVVGGWYSAGLLGQVEAVGYGSPPAVTVSPASGVASATTSVTGASAPAAITSVPPTGVAMNLVSALGTGQPPAITVTAPAGVALNIAAGTGAGSPPAVSVLPPSGVALNIASALGSGAPPAIIVNAPTGIASSAAGVVGYGAPPAIAVGLPTGQISAGALGFGQPNAITCNPPTGVAMNIISGGGTVDSEALAQAVLERLMGAGAQPGALATSLRKMTGLITMR